MKNQNLRLDNLIHRFMSLTVCKSKMTIAIIAFLTIISLNSCKKDKDKVDYRPSAAAFEALRKEALDSLKQTATFKAEVGIRFISKNRVTLTIPPNALTLGGLPVTGDVNLEYTEIFDPGNMAATNRPTMGILPDGKQSLLNSGGEFNILVKQNGTLLNLAIPIPLVVPVKLTDSTAPDMQIFKGNIDTKNNFAWTLQEPDLVKQTGIVVKRDAKDPITNVNELTYETLVGYFGWTNIDRFYSDPRPKTTMLVSVPDGYNYDNCALYLHYDGQGSSLARLDRYDEDKKLFTEHYGQIPIGLACHLIFCTEEDGLWKYAIKPITISADTVYSISTAEMQKGKLKEYVGHVTLLK
ncbi:MAG: hypothetical protein RJA25_1692 [Bacteroidota bacterium]|jgi:hypothetical protein